MTLSRSQVEKLGKRLRQAGAMAPEDAALLEQVIRPHAEPLTRVTRAIQEAAGLAPTPRLKTRGTIVDKLRREKTNLARMQDIAGCRIVLEPGQDLIDQDDVVESIRVLFEPEPRIVDRRVTPSHGYRAVHLIVPIDLLRL